MHNYDAAPGVIKLSKFKYIVLLADGKAKIWVVKAIFIWSEEPVKVNKNS